MNNENQHNVSNYDVSSLKRAITDYRKVQGRSQEKKYVSAQHKQQHIRKPGASNNYRGIYDLNTIKTSTKVQPPNGINSEGSFQQNMVFSALNGGSAKNNSKTYGSAYVEHKKNGSMQQSNHQSYHYKKSSQHSTNVGSEVSSKAHKVRHVNKGVPMQLDPEPLFLDHDSAIDKMNMGRSQPNTAGSENKEQNKHSQISDDIDINVKHQFSSEQQTLDTRKNFETEKQSTIDSKMQQQECVSMVDGQNQTVQVMLQKGQEPTQIAPENEVERRKCYENSNNVASVNKGHGYFNNSQLSDMSHVWSKYKKNIAGSSGSSNTKRNRQNSNSRQEYLMQQHKFQQALQCQKMAEKVLTFQNLVLEQQEKHKQQYTNQKQVRIHSFGRIPNEVHKAKYENKNFSSTFNPKSIPNNPISPNHEYQLATESGKQINGNQAVDSGEVSFRRINKAGTNDMPHNKFAIPHGSITQSNKQNHSKKLAAKISSSVKSTWTVNRSHGNNSQIQQMRQEHNLSHMSDQPCVNNQKEDQHIYTLHQNSALSGGEAKIFEARLDQNNKFEFQANSNLNPQIQEGFDYKTTVIVPPGVHSTKQIVESSQQHGGALNQQYSASFQKHAQKNQPQRSPLQSSSKQYTVSPLKAKQSVPENIGMIEGEGTFANQNFELAPQRKRMSSSQFATSQLAIRRKITNNENYAVQTVRNEILEAISPEGISKAQTNIVSKQNSKPDLETEPFIHQNSQEVHQYEMEKRIQNFKNKPTQKSPKKEKHRQILSNSITQNQRLLSASGQIEEEESKQSGNTPQHEPKNPKEFIYSDPGVKIGNGKFGPVNLIIHNKQLYALKIIPKTSIDKPKRIQHVKNEKAILMSLRKTEESKEPINFVVMLLETFTDEENVNFVFEYLSGQDLFWILANEHNLKLGENMKRRDWVAFYCAEILTGLELLHSRHIIYRDLKPDNVMIDKEGHIKIIDFGFAKKLTNQNNKNFRTYTNCGTIGYTAPEILTGISAGYSFPVDIWSFGILMAELLSGSLPFAETNDPMRIQEQIIQGQLKLQKEGIDFVARDLLQQIFCHEPNLRLGWDRIKEHRFFMFDKSQDYWEKIAAKKYQSVPYTPNPMKYTYLLQNQYESISNLTKKELNHNLSTNGTAEPNSALLEKNDSKSSRDDQPPVFGGQTEEAKSDEQKKNSSVSSKRQTQDDPQAELKKPYKLGDPIAPPPVPGSRPPATGFEMGMFGSGTGKFEQSKTKQQKKGYNDVIYDKQADQSPVTVGRRPKQVLGDFSLFKVNKEFENF